VAHYYDTVKDQRGNARVVSVTVFLAGTSTKASIFSDSGLTVAKTNPFNTNSLGEVDFYITSGLYDLRFEGTNIVTKNLSNISVGVDTGSNIKETPTGALDGVNKVYTLSKTPVAGTLVFIFNGVELLIGALVTDAFPAAYILSGKTITLTNSMTAPNVANTDWIKAEYLA